MAKSTNQLEWLLYQRNLNTRDLAVGAKVSTTTVYKILHNKSVRLEVLWRVCDFLGVSLVEIVQVLPDKPFESRPFPDKKVVITDKQAQVV